VIYIFTHKEYLNYILHWKIYGTGDHVGRDKPNSKDQISHTFAHIWTPDLK
jgi:hypothetical protein